MERYKHYIPDEVLGYQVENLKGLGSVENPLIRNVAAAVSVFVNRLSERGQLCVDVEEVRLRADTRGWRLCIFGENKITSTQMLAIENAFPESSVTVDPNIRSMSLNRAKETVTGAIVVNLPDFPMPPHLLLPPPPPPPPPAPKNTARPSIRRPISESDGVQKPRNTGGGGGHFEQHLSRVQGGGIKKQYGKLRDKRSLTRRMIDFALLGIDVNKI